MIFDCDGVLVDSEPVANRLFAEALAEIGLAWTVQDVTARFVGRTMADCVTEVERELGQPVPPGFLDRLQRRLFAAFRRELRPVRGVVEAIERIALPDCVASSGEPEKMRLTLGLTGLLDHFDGRLFSAVDVPRGKPHPDLFLLAARRMGVPAADCAVVEDSLPGVRAAVSAGMTALAYAAHGDVIALERAGATVFRDMAELPALLGR